MLKLRQLHDEDVPHVKKWLYNEHVKKWYDIPRLGVSIDDWLYELSEREGEFKWITYLIVEMDGVPIGMCQYYKCSDSVDENFGVLPVRGSYGIDYMIGEETYLGKGLGKEMIGLLVEKIFGFADAQRITADIDKDNKASEKVLLACGFKLVDAESSRYVLERPT